MSSRIGSDVHTDEILNYLEKLKHEKKITDQNLNTLERERATLDDQIAELERRRSEVEARLRREKEIGGKQDQAIVQAESAYTKIVDSSRSLADYLRREFQESRRE